MRPIVQLFTPIFFVSVGLSLDLTVVDWGSPFVWIFSLSLALLAIVGKIAAGLLLWREPWLRRTAIGMAMVLRGEVGLVFAELGRVAGVLSGEIYAAVVLVIAYTTVFSPFWIKLFYRRYGSRLHPPGACAAIPSRVVSGDAHHCPAVPASRSAASLAAALL